VRVKLGEIRRPPAAGQSQGVRSLQTITGIHIREFRRSQRRSLAITGTAEIAETVITGRIGDHRGIHRPTRVKERDDWLFTRESLRRSGEEQIVNKAVDQSGLRVSW
jgi:hypothetical protein